MVDENKIAKERITTAQGSFLDVYKTIDKKIIGMAISEITYLFRKY